jgi:peroxiredoxin
LKRLDGSDWSSSELAGRPAALFFFRGNWCPFCTTQVQSVVAGYETLAAEGVEVAMISPQPDEEAKKLADRFNVDLLWLRDEGVEAARRLGIVDEGGVPLGVRGFGTDTVMPTLVVIDAHGRVVFREETDDYRIRPDASTVLGALSDQRS